MLSLWSCVHPTKIRWHITRYIRRKLADTEDPTREVVGRVNYIGLHMFLKYYQQNLLPVNFIWPAKSIYNEPRWNPLLNISITYVSLLIKIYFICKTLSKIINKIGLEFGWYSSADVFGDYALGQPARHDNDDGRLYCCH